MKGFLITQPQPTYQSKTSKPGAPNLYLIYPGTGTDRVLSVELAACSLVCLIACLLSLGRFPAWLLACFLACLLPCSLACLLASFENTFSDFFFVVSVLNFVYILKTFGSPAWLLTCFLACLLPCSLACLRASFENTFSDSIFFIVSLLKFVYILNTFGSRVSGGASWMHHLVFFHIIALVFRVFSTMGLVCLLPCLLACSLALKMHFQFFFCCFSFKVCLHFEHFWLQSVWGSFWMHQLEFSHMSALVG